MRRSNDTPSDDVWAARLEVLLRSTLEIVGLSEATAIGQRMIDVIEALLPYERAAVVLVSDDGSLRLVAHGSKGLGREDYDANFQRVSELIANAPSSGVIRGVVGTGTARRIADVRLEAGYLEGAPGVRSELCVPIAIGQRIIGAINVESIDVDAFTADDERLLALLANQVCLALEKSRLADVADREIESRTVAQADAHVARTLLSSSVESLVDGVALFDADRRLRLCNARFRAFYPKLASLLVSGTDAEALSRAAVEAEVIAETPGAHPAAFRLIEAAPPAAGRQRIFRTTDGRWVEARESIIGHGGQICIHIDITERRRLEAVLAQSQKLEAVGRLTAGIAHDFNNLLAVILGNLELARERIADPETVEMIAAAHAATTHGAELTQRLLAFARRSALSPRLLDANQVVNRMDGLFRRTLPATIKVETILSAGLWRIAVDHAQLESALLNLAINARDAMPDGGVLTLETANVRLGEDYCRDLAGEVAPGRYVMIAVSDTGVGMAPEVQSQVFEPFFTTKPPGEGSGLGLAMVFGFARQSGGNVRIYSEVGRGSTVKLYFPESRLTTEAAPADPLAAPGVRSGTARILVVEDFDGVRAVVVSQLTALGYDVVAAPDANAALAILRGGAHVDLLLTDVVMPGDLQGPQLAAIARAEIPSLKVIFMSGYPKGATENGTSVGLDTPKLTKPIPRGELAAAVHRALYGE